MAGSEGEIVAPAMTVIVETRSSVRRRREGRVLMDRAAVALGKKALARAGSELLEVPSRRKNAKNGGPFLFGSCPR
jgi:hypothetical protein